MKQTEILQIVQTQKDYFASGKTYAVENRINALKALQTAIIKNENEIAKALRLDLGKGSFESYMCEIGLALSEISYMLKHIKKYAKAKTVKTPLAQFPSRSYEQPSPYGTVLVMSPWNYPFMLTMDPVVNALAAGNTVVVKPSAYSQNTSEIIKKIIHETFETGLVAVVTGGRQENSCLLEQKFDYIFFTGSYNVGKDVMHKAAEYLTPVTLELGGKSPCIVDKSANIAIAAKRIVFGRFLNCGQTCVAPDYIYCHESIKPQLVKAIKSEIALQYTNSPLTSGEYGKIINEKHFERLLGLIEPEKVVHGGKSNAETLQIEPTVMDNVSWDDNVMQEEIFGPICPILPFDDLSKVISIVNSKPKPLALYFFAQDKTAQQLVTQNCSFGGGCINDTIIHLATSEMGFGGVGESGMGSYHGKKGFDTFTHYKSIVNKKTWLDLPMRYKPYTKLNEKILRIFLK